MILGSTSNAWSKYSFGAFQAAHNNKHVNKLYNKIHARDIVTTPESVINNIYLESGHVIRIDPNFTHTSIPTSSEWTKPSSIRVLTTDAKQETPTKVHYFAGGVPALMQAVYKLYELGTESAEQVVYINDGKIPKSIQSGHQGHVHPTEWASEDCYIPNLFKTMLQGMGAMRPANPNDLENYSYLHFPISITDVLKNPNKFLKLYGNFFKQRLKHNYKSVNGVSKLDRWLCDGIRKSLKFHKELSDQSKRKQAFPLSNMASGSIGRLI